MGDGGDTAGGVGGHGTYEEDGPVTWETPASPRDSCGPRSPANRNSEGLGVLRVHAETREEEDTFHEVGPRQGEPEQKPMGVGESEDRISER